MVMQEGSLEEITQNIRLEMKEREEIPLAAMLITTSERFKENY
jgi:hypothetical protein